MILSFSNCYCKIGARLYSRQLKGVGTYLAIKNDKMYSHEWIQHRRLKLSKSVCGVRLTFIIIIALRMKFRIMYHWYETFSVPTTYRLLQAIFMHILRDDGRYTIYIRIEWIIHETQMKSWWKGISSNLSLLYGQGYKNDDTNNYRIHHQHIRT